MGGFPRGGGKLHENAKLKPLGFEFARENRLMKHCDIRSGTWSNLGTAHFDAGALKVQQPPEAQNDETSPIPPIIWTDFNIETPRNWMKSGAFCRRAPWGEWLHFEQSGNKWEARRKVELMDATSLA